MKILVIHTYYDQRSDEDIVVENEVDLLKSGGYEVELLHFNNDGNVFLKLLQLPFNFHSYSQVKSKINTFKPDIIHLHNLHFGGSPSIIYAAKEFKLPIVCTLHNYSLIFPPPVLFAKKKSFADRVRKKFNWTMLKHKIFQDPVFYAVWLTLSTKLHSAIRTWGLVDEFILPGEHIRQFYLQSGFSRYSERMSIKPYYYNEIATQEPKQTADNYYLYMGPLTDERGIPVLLEAFADNQLPLKIAGTGFLRRLIIGYSLHYPNITLLGQLSKKENAELLQNATALLYPAINCDAGTEIMMSFSKGVPAICSTISNTKDMVIDQYNGLFFETGSAKDLEAKVRYYQDLPLAEKTDYRERARSSYLDKYTPAKNIAQLTEIYKSLLTSSG